MARKLQTIVNDKQWEITDNSEWQTMGNCRQWQMTDKGK